MLSLSCESVEPQSGKVLVERYWKKELGFLSSTDKNKRLPSAERLDLFTQSSQELKVGGFCERNCPRVFVEFADLLEDTL